MDQSRTEREKVKDLLEHSIDGLTPEELSAKLSDKNEVVPEKRIVEHITHIRKSLRHEDKQIMAMPPKCLECGYDSFDKIVNIPSKCPSDNCHSRRIAEPKFVIKS